MDSAARISIHSYDPLTATRTLRVDNKAAGAAANESQYRPVIWEGYAHKKGGARGGFKNWRKRWIRIDAFELRYYKTKPPSSEISLSSRGRSTKSAAAIPTIDELMRLRHADGKLLLGILPLKGARILDVDDTSPTASSATTAVHRESAILDDLILTHNPLYQAPIDDSNTKNAEESTAIVPWRVASHICQGECGRKLTHPLTPQFCRRCGNTFCNLCCNKKSAMPKRGFPQPTLVCNSCYAIVNAPTTTAARTMSKPKNDTIHQINNAGAMMMSDDEMMMFARRLIKCIPPSSNKKQQKPHMLSIKTPERELWLSASSLNDKREMIIAVVSIALRYQFKLQALPSFYSATMKSTVAQTQINKHKTQYGDGEDDKNKDNEKQRERDVFGKIWEIEYSDVKIMQRVASGAFGTVYRGRLWGTDVAIKTMSNSNNDNFIISPQELDDMKKEVEILSQLRHPNVVLYIGACLTPPHVVIVTEWCDRGSLSDILYNTDQLLDASTIIQYAMGIAQGMNYLHSLNRRIVHRDLKSRNILVTNQGTIKVADFGLSYVRRSRKTNGTSHANHENSLSITPDSQFVRRNTAKSNDDDDDRILRNVDESTIQGGLAGTPEYIAPEMMEGAKYNQSVDIYSFGIVLSELLARKLPYRDRYAIHTYNDVVEAVLEDGAKPTIPSWAAASSGGESGGELERLVLDCTNRNPSMRPSFDTIILRLRRLYPLETVQIFVQYDLPRIQYQLDNTGDAPQQRRALCEIQLLASDRERACSCCGHAPHRLAMLDHSHIIDLIRRILLLLLSPHSDIVFQAIRALIALFTCNNGSGTQEEDTSAMGRDPSITSAHPHDHSSKYRNQHEYIGVICENGGMIRLGSYASSNNIESNIRNASIELLSMIISVPSPLPSNQRLINGLDARTLAELHRVLTLEISHKQQEHDALLNRLEQKRLLSTWLELRAQNGGAAIQVQRIPTNLKDITTSSQEQQQKQNEITEKSSNSGLATKRDNTLWKGKRIRKRGTMFLLNGDRSNWKSVYVVLLERSLLVFANENDFNAGDDDDVKNEENEHHDNASSRRRPFINAELVNEAHKSIVRFRIGRKRGRHNCLQIALPTDDDNEDDAVEDEDVKSETLRRLFFNVESRDTLNEWSDHMHELIQQYEKICAAAAPDAIP